MANTTNLDLVKPELTDQALITVINANSDKIDDFAGKTKDDIETLEEGLAYIVGDTNTTGNTLAVGQFVYVKGHSTIPNGLRKVTASISNNGSITTSNTSPDTAGGLNTLKNEIADLQKSSISYGTLVNISSYTSQNPYTCPSDGYVRVATGGVITGPANSSMALIENATFTCSCYVKKGMKVWPNTGSTYAYFFPFS